MTNPLFSGGEIHEDDFRGAWENHWERQFPNFRRIANEAFDGVHPVDLPEQERQELLDRELGLLREGAREKHRMDQLIVLDWIDLEYSKFQARRPIGIAENQTNVAPPKKLKERRWTREDSVRATKFANEEFTRLDETKKPRWPQWVWNVIRGSDWDEAFFRSLALVSGDGNRRGKGNRPKGRERSPLFSKKEELLLRCWREIQIRGERECGFLYWSDRSILELLEDEKLTEDGLRSCYKRLGLPRLGEILVKKCAIVRKSDNSDQILQVVLSLSDGSEKIF